MADAGELKPLENASRLLVAGPAWLGDMIMAHSLIRHLTGQGHEVAVVAPASTAAIAERMPGVSAVHTLEPGHGEVGLLARRRLGIRLRAERFSQAFVLQKV